MRTPREIGKILKDARQKKGLSLEKIWNTTRMQGKVIEALEEGTVDDFLNKVYVLLFLKKYASLLELDADDLVESYKAFYKGPEEQVLAVTPKKPFKLTPGLRKFITALLVGIFTGLVFFVVISLGIRVKTFYRSRRVTARSTPQKTPRITGFSKQAKAIFPISKNKPIDLSLKCSDDVWLKMWKDGKILFEGTLRKGKKKSLSAEDKIRLWSGRAEAMDITVNGVFIGKVGRGNIKKIEISRNGLKVGKKWLIGAKN